MKSARYYGVRDVRFEDVAKPEYGNDDVLIKVAYAGICGSDLHIYNRGMFIANIPEIMGHEFVGIVESVGNNITNFKAGDKVTANPMVVCDDCYPCNIGYGKSCENLGFIGEVRPGCFAEYITMPESSLVHIPNNAELRQMALVEPLAVALNVCERASLKTMDKLCIIGAGPIGLLTVLVAKNLYGIDDIVVMGRSQARLDLASKAGARETTNDISNYRFNKIIETAGKEQTINSAINSIVPNGDICVVSVFEDDITLDMNTLVSKEANVHGCNVYENRHLEEAASVIAQNKLDVELLISETYTLEECAEAFKRLSEGDKKVCKIIFEI